jgi:phospho-N-acetylmuramoyl-pentapeptide-transferase
VLFELLWNGDRPLFDLPGMWLLRYISFRTVAATLFAFLLVLAIGGAAIAALRRWSIGENTDKSDSTTLRDLHKDKRGTPTMGGLFLIGAMLVTAVLWCRFDGINRWTIVGLSLIAWYAGVGFLDDWIKLRIQGRNGLSKRAKQGLLTLGALGAVLWMHALGFGGADGPALHVPFLREPVATLGWIAFAIVGAVVLSGTANAVNLTDGLDGLAIGCVITSTLAFAGICYFVGRSDFSEYLMVSHVPGAGEITVMLGSLLGAAFGFLWFNAPPARVFMGDVGSLPLGGALGFAALVSRTELMLLFIGGVFVAEAVSVMLQVASFRLRKKRIFRCAPFHHHFQFAGVPETRIVVRLWLISGLLAMASLALFKVR